MLESFGLVAVLLPLGAALGWYLARQDANAPPAQRGENADFLAGLSFLASDDPDQALAALQRAADLDEGAIELHLSLGSLFRKRGEVDRAIRVHQGIVARPQLDPRQLERARHELAQDYQKAGLLDHAEKLFEGLAVQGAFVEPALAALLAICEQQRDWGRAAATAARLESVRGQSLRPQIAHYHCELSDQARQDGDLKSAEQHALRALDADSASVRASLQLGTLREAAGNLVGAIGALRRVPEQNLRFLGEALPLLQRMHTAGRDLESHWKYLEELGTLYPAAVAPAVARAALMRDAGMDPTAFLTERMAERPSWGGLALLLEATRPEPGSTLGVLAGAVRRLIEATPRYRCTQCGLTPRLLFWHCPGCKRWGSIEPVPDEITPR